MAKKIFIVGGNGFARECYIYLQMVSKYDSNVIFGGFLGHGGYGHTVDYKQLQHFYLGEVCEHKFSDDEYAIIGAGYPELRKKIYHDLKKMNVQFYNLIPEPGSHLSDFVQCGEANIFNPSCLPSVDVKIGNGNAFNCDVIIGHDVEIGDFNFFGPRSQVLGEAKVGDMNQVGANSVILPNAKVGNNNKIAPLSAIYKGCKNNGYYTGNPAIKVGDIENV